MLFCVVVRPTLMFKTYCICSFKVYVVFTHLIAKVTFARAGLPVAAAPLPIIACAAPDATDALVAADDSSADAAAAAEVAFVAVASTAYAANDAGTMSTWLSTSTL